MPMITNDAHSALSQRVCKCFFLCICISLLSFNLSAQDEPFEDAPSQTPKTQMYDAEESEIPETSVPIALGVSAGLHAIVAADIAFGLSDAITIRAGYNHLNFQVNEYDISATDLGIGTSDKVLLFDADTDLSAAQLWLDWAPGGERLFRITAGAAYVFTNEISVKGRFRDNVNLRDLELTPEEVGEVSITYSSNSILPYLGLGFGPSIPKKRVVLNLDIGTYYRGAPDINIEATGMLEGNANIENEMALENNTKQYKWHPVVLLRFAVKLN